MAALFKNISQPQVFVCVCVFNLDLASSLDVVDGVESLLH